MDCKVILRAGMILLIIIAAEQCIYTQAKQDGIQTQQMEKRLEAIQDSILSVEASMALEQLDFVVEANRLAFKRGETAYVTSHTNFVSLSENRSVIQIAPFHSGGPNGIGGITLEGKASNVKLKTNKKGDISLTMNVTGTGVCATVDVCLPKNSYMASVTVSSNLHSNRVTLYGYILPTSKANIFKGQSF